MSVVDDEDILTKIKDVEIDETVKKRILPLYKRPD
jgi:hypothetical protein